MSTRSSLYYRIVEKAQPPHDDADVHIYKEMHDGQIHLEICDGSYSAVNVILTPELWATLHACLVPPE